jgi:hypothetical protein
LANYVKATNFAVKDSLASGNPAKIVKGTEIDVEFNAIASAIASKLEGDSPSLTGTPLAPTASTATNNTQISTTAYVVNRIAQDIAGKANIASPTFTGTPAAPTAAAGTNTTQLATTAFVQTALQTLYPVGSVYINATNSTNPGTLLGFGTWVAFGAGRVPVGFNASDPLFDSAEETGGSKDAIVVSHNHTATSTVTDPGHKHFIVSDEANTTSSPAPSNSNQVNYAGWTNEVNDSRYVMTGTSSAADVGLSSSSQTSVTVATTVATAGSSGTNANLQPYITVFMWKRVS